MNYNFFHGIDFFLQKGKTDDFEISIELLRVKTLHILKILSGKKNNDGTLSSSYFELYFAMNSKNIFDIIDSTILSTTSRRP